jgi:trimethylamine:corrinoid methyltransferase-like protein
LLVVVNSGAPDSKLIDAQSFPDMGDRQKYDSWKNSGMKSMSYRTFEEEQGIIADKHPDSIEEKLLLKSTTCFRQYARNC